MTEEPKSPETQENQVIGTSKKKKLKTYGNEEGAEEMRG